MRRPTQHRRRRHAALIAFSVAGTTVMASPATAAPPPNDAAYVSQSMPTTLFCGQTASVSVTMRNTGTATWSGPVYALRSQNPPGNTTWGVSSVAAPVGVGPQSTATFSFTITAPAAAGTYNLQWRMSAGGVDFGESTPNVTVPVVCASSNGYKVGYRELAGSTLANLFTDAAHVELDQSFNAPMVRAHAETSTVFWGGRYLMYYRQTDQTKNDTCAVDKGLAIALATSTDGTNWVEHNGGQPVFRIQGDEAYGPAVMVDRDAAGRPRLTMAFERSPGCGAQPQRVARTYSYDGITWSGWTDVVVPVSGTWEHGLGTPQLLRTPDNVYRVGYHGFRGTDGANAIQVGFASGTSFDGPLPTKTGPLLGNAAAYKPGSWASAGPGRGDLLKEGAYWYMVVEGMRDSVACGTNELSSWGLARTSDATLRTGWTFSARNPIRVDRAGRACGEDMPSFQVVNGVPYIVTTHKQQFTTTTSGLPANLPQQRYRIVSGPRGQMNGTSVAAIARTPDGRGYYEVTAKGHVYAFGTARYHGGVTIALNAPIVGMAVTPTGGGYWLVASDGGIFNYGDAPFKGSAASLPLVQPVVGMAATPSGQGYWLVAGDGGVFNYGDAVLHGSMGGKPLNKPVVGMAATTTGGGYWLAGADGGIFAFGDAGFHGSTGSLVLNQPIVGIAGTASNQGYWMVGKDGGIFAFGDAQFLGGSQGAPAYTTGLGTSWAVGLASAPASVGAGYWLVFNDGGVLEAGAAGYFHDVSYGAN